MENHHPKELAILLGLNHEEEEDMIKYELNVSSSRYLYVYFQELPYHFKRFSRRICLSRSCKYEAMITV